MPIKIKSPGAVGAAAGAALGAGRSLSREFKMRAQEEGTRSPEELKKARRKRVLWHLGSTATAAGMGAAAGHFGAKAGRATYGKLKGEVTKGVTEGKRHIDDVASNLENKVKSTASHVGDTTKATASHIEGAAKNVGDTVNKTISHVEKATKDTSSHLGNEVRKVNRGALTRLILPPDEIFTQPKESLKAVGRAAKKRFQGIMEGANARFKQNLSDAHKGKFSSVTGISVDGFSDELHKIATGLAPAGAPTVKGMGSGLSPKVPSIGKMPKFSPPKPAGGMISPTAGPGALPKTGF